MAHGAAVDSDDRAYMYIEGGSLRGAVKGKYRWKNVEEMQKIKLLYGKICHNIDIVQWVLHSVIISGKL